MAAISVEFCGQWWHLEDGCELLIGRDADLALDEDNPFLHRRFLAVVPGGSLWWLANVGSRLTATITDGSGTLQAWLAPGGRIPLVFARTRVVFTAGPTTYELGIRSESPAFDRAPHQAALGQTTIGAVPLTLGQKQLILALAEPLLRRDGCGLSAVPTGAEAAARLGWAPTTFNRKLDNVCDKLDRLGVRGLRGGPGRLASNRRARLVEHAVLTRLVTIADLPLLDMRAQDRRGAAPAEDGAETGSETGCGAASTGRSGPPCASASR